METADSAAPCTEVASFVRLQMPALSSKDNAGSELLIKSFATLLTAAHFYFASSPLEVYFALCVQLLCYFL